MGQFGSGFPSDALQCDLQTMNRSWIHAATYHWWRWLHQCHTLWERFASTWSHSQDIQTVFPLTHQRGFWRRSWTRGGCELRCLGLPPNTAPWGCRHRCQRQPGFECSWNSKIQNVNELGIEFSVEFASQDHHTVFTHHNMNNHHKHGTHWSGCMVTYFSHSSCLLVYLPRSALTNSMSTFSFSNASLSFHCKSCRDVDLIQPGYGIFTLALSSCRRACSFMPWV